MFILEVFDIIIKYTAYLERHNYMFIYSMIICLYIAYVTYLCK